MVEVSVASFLRASSPRHRSIANATVGFRSLGDDTSTAASSSSIGSIARCQLAELQSTRFGDRCSSGFEEELIEELVLEASVPQMHSSDFAPPSTPQPTSCPVLASPPVAPREQVMPLLMKALKLNSAELVEEAIMQEPGVAFFPFWDHHVEPPLCFAVRHRCSAAIVRLLLQHGADPDCQDIHGKCPADIVSSMRASMFNTARYEDLPIIEQILGVRPEVAATVSVLPMHSHSDVMVGCQPSWGVMADFFTNVPTHPPWANFSSSDLPLLSAFECNVNHFHHQEGGFPWPAECGPAV